MTDADPQRPARPAMVEAAAAILLVGGILGIAETVIGTADLDVVGVLVHQRRWFDALAAWRASLPIETRPVR